MPSKTEVAGSGLTGNQRFRRPGRVEFERECQMNTHNRKCGEGETITKTSQQRSSPLPGERRRRRSQREIAFPAAAHRAAPEAPPRKEQADQAIDLSALDPVSRTAAARTFPIVRAVHRPGPRKPVGCAHAPGVTAPHGLWPAARRCWLHHDTRPGGFRPSQYLYLLSSLPRRLDDSAV
jgi:hypothetical protein